MIDSDFLDGVYLQLLEFTHGEFLYVAETPPIGEL